MAVDTDLTPKISQGTASVDNEFIAQGREWALKGIVTIAQAARDLGNTPTTKLRKGLVLGRITTSGKYAEYHGGATPASDGTEVARAILDRDVNLLDPDGNARDVVAPVVFDSAVMIHTERTHVDDDLGGDASDNLDTAGQADFQNFIFMNSDV